MSSVKPYAALITLALATLCIPVLAAGFTETPLPDGNHMPPDGQRKYYESPNRDHLKNIEDVLVNDLSSKDDFAISPDVLQDAINAKEITLEEIWSSYANINLGSIHLKINYHQYRIHYLKGPEAGTVTPGGLVIGQREGGTGQTLTWIFSQPYGTTRGFLNAIAAAETAKSLQTMHTSVSNRLYPALKKGHATITRLPKPLFTPPPR